MKQDTTPQPTRGGSYTRDAETGALTLVGRTLSREEAQALQQEEQEQPAPAAPVASDATLTGDGNG